MNYKGRCISVKYIISIDDTDNLQSYSTGVIAEFLSEIISTKFECSCSDILRHQLLLDDRIKYTSHNSSMSFEVNSHREILNEIIDISKDFLEKNHAKEADPGLCIVPTSKLNQTEKLIEFGFKAKNKVIQMKEAYELARELNIHLSAHGGSGEGIIGALAGAGLRLSGNDGKYRKTVAIDINGEDMSVNVLIKQANIDCVCDIDGNEIDKNNYIYIRDRIKKVIKDKKTVLLVKKIKIDNEEIWTNYTVKELKDLNL